MKKLPISIFALVTLLTSAAGATPMQSSIVDQQQVFSLGSSGQGGGDGRVMLARMKETKADWAPVLAERLLGRAKEIRRRYLETLIFGQGQELRARLKSFVDHGRESILDREVRQAFDRMVASGLGDEINRVQFIRKNVCLDEKGQARALSTAQGVRGAPICVNLDRLVEDFVPTNEELSGYLVRRYPNGLNIDDLELVNYFDARRPQDSDDQLGLPDIRLALPWTVGLFMHDFARHFNIDDANHDFAVKIADAYGSSRTLQKRTVHTYLKRGDVIVDSKDARFDFYPLEKQAAIPVYFELTDVSPDHRCSGLEGYFFLSFQWNYKTVRLNLGKKTRVDVSTVTDSIDAKLIPAVQVQYKEEFWTGPKEWMPRSSACKEKDLVLSVYDIHGLKVGEGSYDNFSDSLTLPMAWFSTLK